MWTPVPMPKPGTDACMLITLWEVETGGFPVYSLALGSLRNTVSRE